MHALLAALALNQASASALPNLDSKYYVVGDTDNGPVYSSVAPNHRRDTPDVAYYPVSTNEDGTVYSSVDLNAKKQKRNNGTRTPISQEMKSSLDIIQDRLSCILQFHRLKWKADYHEEIVT